LLLSVVGWGLRVDVKNKKKAGKAEGIKPYINYTVNDLNR